MVEHANHIRGRNEEAQDKAGPQPRRLHRATNLACSVQVCEQAEGQHARENHDASTAWQALQSTHTGTRGQMRGGLSVMRCQELLFSVPGQRLTFAAIHSTRSMDKTAILRCMPQQLLFAGLRALACFV